MNSRRAATPGRSRVVPPLGPGRLRQTLRTCVILPLGTCLLPGWRPASWDTPRGVCPKCKNEPEKLFRINRSAEKRT